MANPPEQEPEKPALPCDRRYRSSKYFLQDQLRCSEAAADFRSVKALAAQVSAFNIHQAFQFQTQAVPIQTSDP